MTSIYDRLPNENLLEYERRMARELLRPPLPDGSWRKRSEHVGRHATDGITPLESTAVEMLCGRGWIRSCGLWDNGLDPYPILASLHRKGLIERRDAGVTANGIRRKAYEWKTE